MEISQVVPHSSTEIRGNDIEGRSNRSIFLEISDKEVIFHAASSLWGKETYEAEEAILVNIQGWEEITW